MISSNKIIHLNGLNGLRAIAAIAVIISHTTQGLQHFGLNPSVFGKSADGKPIGLLLGGFGVSIFFALSGFLITFLLLKEKEVATINVKQFYIRRALRIWPLYYLYLAVSLFVLWQFHEQAHFEQAGFYIFMFANIPFISGLVIPLVAHYWSLGVEEQFYLLWPWLLKINNGKLFKILITATITLIGLKLFASRVPVHISALSLYDIIHITRFHCMMIGAIGAILYYNNNQTFVRITTNIPVQLLCWAIIALLAINKFHLASVIDNELVSCISVCLIMSQIAGKKKLINLDNKPCNFLGKISYGLYVIHPLLIYLFAKWAGDSNIAALVKYILVYSVVLSGTILVAYFSYTFYEKKFLRLKLRYAVIRSSDTARPELFEEESKTRLP